MIPAEFGATPWGRSWVRTVASTAAAGPNALLPRARSLARNHAVTLSADGGRLEADVRVSGVGNRVRLVLPPWPAETREQAERLIATALADNRGLAPGDLPDSLDGDFRRHGISVGVGLDELVSECDCRSRRRPCLHVLATIYALSQLVDERPALAVELRMSPAALAPPPDPDWVPLADVDPASFYGG
ncbi:SWIM zinc finger family protein [Micromonospora sp. WMMD734]|uniref:SWIM zinc finger family protein n=1 Tax=Micromonospora sp. WMMD734 TaxID=3404129 RepID=UPI003B95B523